MTEDEIPAGFYDHFRLETSSETFKWLVDHFGEMCYGWSLSTRYENKNDAIRLYFKTEDDAMLFKLVWAGKGKPK